MANKMTGKTVEYFVIDKNGTYVSNQHGYLRNQFGWEMNDGNNDRMSRRIARAFKNFLNEMAPNRAPFRIAQVVITK